MGMLLCSLSLASFASTISYRGILECDPPLDSQSPLLCFECGRMEMSHRTTLHFASARLRKKGAHRGGLLATVASTARLKTSVSRPHLGSASLRGNAVQATRQRASRGSVLARPRRDISAGRPVLVGGTRGRCQSRSPTSSRIQHRRNNARMATLRMLLH